MPPLNNTVEHGRKVSDIIKLWGAVTDDRERIALTVLAEKVAGVSKVVDEMVWVESVSGMVFEPSARETVDDPGPTKRR